MKRISIAIFSVPQFFSNSIGQSRAEHLLAFPSGKKSKLQPL